MNAATTIRVRVLSTAQPIPDAHDALLAPAGEASLLHSRAWIEHYARHGVPAGDWLRLYAAEDVASGAPVALLPATVTRLNPQHPRSRLVHFSQPEGLPYQPIFDPSRIDAAVAVRAAVHALRADPRACDAVRVTPLAQGAPATVAFANALREAGFALQAYRFHDDAYGDARAGEAAQYLASRPATLRGRLEQARTALFNTGRARARIVDGATGLDEAAAQYLELERASMSRAYFEWPEYGPGMMRIAAAAGVLRAGVIELDGKPAAIQVWILQGTSARCLRIWGAPDFESMPLDDCLTARIAERLIDGDGVTRLEFGAVTPEFAADWATGRAERIGLLGVNLHTRRGLRDAVRHIGPRALKNLAKRLLRRGTPGPRL